MAASPRVGRATRRIIVRVYVPVLPSPHPRDAAGSPRRSDRMEAPVTAVSEAPTATGSRRSQPAGVVVTGAAQGLGKAIARRFAADGGHVVALDLHDSVTDVVREFGEGHDAVVGDATDPDVIRSACERAAELGGGLRTV